MVRLMPRHQGFTLIEFVMVILLLGILAAVAIPTFQDFRTDARNAATQGNLGGLRSAIMIARAAIALKESTTTPSYPAIVEMQTNVFILSHPVLSGTKILDSGVPQNPWTISTITATSTWASVWECNALTKSFLRSTAAESDQGWCYRHTTGEIWANSDKNAGATTQENQY